MWAVSNDKITHPRIIVCEGPDDAVFFSRLIHKRKLPKFHIYTTAKERGGKGGNSKFGEKISALLVERRIRSVVKNIVVITDSDGDHDKSFLNVKRQIEKIGLKSPNKPMELTDGKPSISILMIPDTSAGNLECICQSAAASTNKKISAATDHFISLVTEEKWSKCASGKLWLRAYMAARWMNDPCINLAELLTNKKAKDIIPLTHNSFDGIAKFIGSIK